ncbi:helix-turn-helix domain-containing protein [Streptomyces sp. NPDC047061]|uniref:ArsR/SmtB family transcription factor n=1 Tax=Streptomyces sp. NPDC047061 TaxID=3154605 RepID=UPI0033FDE9F2
MPATTKRPSPTNATSRLPEPTRDEIRVERVLHALSDPIRLRVVTELAAAATDLNCLAFELPVSKSTCTYHFRVLREAGVIHQYPQGTSRMNSLRSDDLRELFPGLLDSAIQGARDQWLRLTGS